MEAARSPPRLANNARAQAADTLILVGSEGHSTWGFAKTLHDAMAAAGHRVHTAPMNRLLPSYRRATRMFILTATYGDGTAPASASQFLARLDAIKTAPDIRVVILGFGDRQFPRFCQFAKDVERAMRSKGWRRFQPLDTIDRQSVQAFSLWGIEIGKRIGTELTLLHTPSRPPSMSLRLIERTDYGAEVQAPTSILRFAAPEHRGRGMWRRIASAAMPRFEAGDLVGVLPPGSPLPRSYSLASSSSDGVLEICVRKHPGGLCSSFLHSLRPGGSLIRWTRDVQRHYTRQLRPSPSWRRAAWRRMLWQPS